MGQHRQGRRAGQQVGIGGRGLVRGVAAVTLGHRGRASALAAPEGQGAGEVRPRGAAQISLHAWFCRETGPEQCYTRPTRYADGASRRLRTARGAASPSRAAASARSTPPPPPTAGTAGPPAARRPASPAPATAGGRGRTTSGRPAGGRRRRGGPPARAPGGQVGASGQLALATRTCAVTCSTAVGSLKPAFWHPIS